MKLILDNDDLMVRCSRCGAHGSFDVQTSIQRDVFIGALEELMFVSGWMLIQDFTKGQMAICPNCNKEINYV